MSLKKIVIEVGGKTDLQSTINQLVQLGVIDEKNAKSFLKNSKSQQNAIKESTKGVGLFEKALSNIGPTLAGAFAVSKILDLGKAIIDTTAKFEKFEAVLTNTLGSKSQAQKALNMIKDFAAKTPFQVDELTESYVKLANQGFKPTVDQMRRLGDLAASTGKSFNQLTEAIIDAQTGEFERLKEFGIRASKEGDKVTFAFKGVSTQVDFTNDSIRNYILSLGELEGVSGAMAAISETVGGKISNLSDAFDSLFNSLGSASSGVLKSTIDTLGNLVHGLEIALLTQEQIEQRISAKRNQVRTNQVMGFIEADIKKLAAVSASEDEARDLVLRARILEWEEDVKINRVLLEKQQKLFGELRSTEQDEILNDLQTEITFGEQIIAEITGRLTAIDKAKADQLEADKKRREQEKKEEEKRAKERQEQMKREIEALKAHLIERENVEKQRFVNGEINEEELNKRLKDLTLKFQQDEINILKKYGQSTVEVRKQILDQEVKDKIDAEKEKHDAMVMANNEEFRLIEAQLKADHEASEKSIEIARKEAEQKKQIRQQVSNEAIKFIDQLLLAEQELGRRKTDAEIERVNLEADSEIQAIQRRVDKGNLSYEEGTIAKDKIQKKAAQKEFELKKKQFQADKNIALTRVAIETAVSVIKTAASVPYPANLPLIALAVAEGALQAALISSQPTPKFKDGVIDFNGKGTGTSDSNLVRISRGESVINAESTSKYKGLLEEINKGTYNYQNPKMIRKSLSEVRHESMADNIYKSMMMQNGWDDQRLVNAVKDNKRSKEEDAKLASMIGAKISDKLYEDKLFK